MIALDGSSNLATNPFFPRLAWRGRFSQSRVCIRLSAEGGGKVYTNLDAEAEMDVPARTYGFIA